MGMIFTENGEGARDEAIWVRDRSLNTRGLALTGRDPRLLRAQASNCDATGSHLFLRYAFETKEGST